jgi:uncharacterized protein YfaS (alpha-2-macroglobulin family)
MIDNSEFDIGQSLNTTYSDTFVYIYTDRPLYKPSDEIFVKGIVRAYGTGGYTLLPKGTRGTLLLTKNDGEPLRE